MGMRTPASSRWAHPRSRGENLGPLVSGRKHKGSSPLTRGKHPPGQHRRGWRGLIPAHAGKTGVMWSGSGLSGAHPRSRGENHAAIDWVARSEGSSPLTRGKRHEPHPRREGLRLIPAHAGKTGSKLPTRGLPRAHPRSRGENSRWKSGERRSRGSSPLTRGKRVGSVVFAGVGGLIPAHAGKTGPCARWSCGYAAHPRSRGENVEQAVSEGRLRGSSPLTRGKRIVSSARVIVIGLIPAHAGKTDRSGIARKDTGAHPRSRGENTIRLRHAASTSGSSPLTRGKPRVRHGAGRRGGLIPAHAGKTARAPTSPTSPRAHPRSRGENGLGEAVLDHLQGSSPLTRGKRTRGSGPGSSPGLIPAHAGKTC